MQQDFIKDPDAVLDYTINWAAWLDGDTISTSTWTVADGITIDSEAETTTTTTVWFSGGTVGQDYNATNHIVTVAGREDDRTICIRVRQQ